MRTIVILFVITSILLCGFTAAAQQEGQPGSPTAPAVEGAPGSETGAVEGTPGAPTDTSAEAAPGDSTDTEDAEEEEEDRGNGGGNVDQNPNLNLQPQIVRERVIERRTQVVREIAAASRAGDQATVKRLTIELGKLNERLALVEANPLGGTEGQRRLWQDVLLPAGIKSESYLREHYGLEPVSAPETEQDTMPARPAKGSGKMPLALQIILGALGAAGVILGIIALTRNGNLAVLAGALGDAANRAQNNERLTFSAGPGRMRLTVEPANATPVIPPALAPAAAQPAFPQAAPGQAYVPVTFSPVNVQLAPVAPQQPAPAPAPAATAPQAQQPLQVYFNNNMQGQQPAPQQRQPQAPQAQQPAPQGQQPRQPRNQPRNQGPANPPAAGQGAPPAQGGGQGGNAPANP